MKRYLWTTQGALRRSFREQFTNLDFRKLESGDWKTDTRCAFVDWIDNLARAGYISERLAQRATL